MQAGGGDLRQQDGHVLLLLPQPDQPLPDVGVYHAQRHLLLPTQSLVEVCEVSSHTGTCTLGRAGDLMKARGINVNVRRKAQPCMFNCKQVPSYMLSVCHASSILYYLLSTFYLLHDAHQLPRVLRHFVRKGADAVGHVQNGCTDLISFSL